MKASVKPSKQHMLAAAHIMSTYCFPIFLHRLVRFCVILIAELVSFDCLFGVSGLPEIRTKKMGLSDSYFFFFLLLSSVSEFALHKIRIRNLGRMV